MIINDKERNKITIDMLDSLKKQIISGEIQIIKIENTYELVKSPFETMWLSLIKIQYKDYGSNKTTIRANDGTAQQP